MVKIRSQIRVRTHDCSQRLCHHRSEQSEHQRHRKNLLDATFGRSILRRLRMSIARTDSLIRRMLDNAFNLGTFAVVDDVVASNGITHTPMWGIPQNREGLKQLIAMFRSAFPDLHCTLEDEITEGDKVAAHWTMRGTHRGLFLGTPPTSRSIEFEGMMFARTENGQIAEGWTMIDQMGMLQQLGLVPPPRHR
jgi:steroid delta-isomerase-like uncharacterized protein